MVKEPLTLNFEKQCEKETPEDQNLIDTPISKKEKKSLIQKQPNKLQIHFNPWENYAMNDQVNFGAGSKEK